MPTPSPQSLPATAGALRAHGWKSRPVKAELRDNLTAALREGRPLFPGVLGYDDTVIPEIINAVLAGHDILFLGEKGQGKSRLMRLLAGFLDPLTPYLDIPGCPVHEDPFAPITGARASTFSPSTATARQSPGGPARAATPSRRAGHQVRRHHRRDRPGQTPRGHKHVRRGRAALWPHPAHAPPFAMNELPDLDDVVQVGLFNILEERDACRSAATPALRDRCRRSLLCQPHPPTTAAARSSPNSKTASVPPSTRTTAHARPGYPDDPGAGADLGGEYPVLVPRFMIEVVEQMSIAARRSRYVDHASGASARFSLSNYRTMGLNQRRAPSH